MRKFSYLAAGCLALAVAVGGVLSSPLAHSATKAPAATALPSATTLPSANTVFQDWNNAFLVQNGTGSYGSDGTAGTYYTNELKSVGDHRAGTWIGGYDIAGAEDAYERTHSPADRELVSKLVTTFLADDGTNWTSYDGWDDDIAWMLDATLRGYQITGNKAWLNVAVNQWNSAYNRGWDAYGGGGLWERLNPDFSKCTLSNEPFVFTGVSLYRITGNAYYLTKAEEIYNWVYKNLVNSTTGVVNECLAFPNYPAGNYYQQSSDNAYNGGLLIEAADALYRATGNKTYYNQALVTVNHWIDNYPIPSNGGGAGTTYQFWLFKGIDDFCTDTGTCAKYASYLYSNAARAWSERNSAGLTWNNWSEPTNDPKADAYEMESMVELFQDFPVTGATPFHGYYHLKNANSGKLVSVRGDSKAANAPVIQETSAKDASAVWSFARESNGYYEIRNARSKLLVNVAAASGAPHAKLLQWPAQGILQGNDQWMPVHNANGTWSFYNRNSQLALAIASTAAGTQLVQESPSNRPAQQFALSAA
jgi:hypothetical protein